MKEQERDDLIKDSLNKINEKIKDLESKVNEKHDLKTDCKPYGINLKTSPLTTIYSVMCDLIDHKSRYSNIEEKIKTEYGIDPIEKSSAENDSNYLDDCVWLFNKKKIQVELADLKIKKEKLDLLYSENMRKDLELQNMLESLKL